LAAASEFVRVSFGIGLLGRYQFKEALTSFPPHHAAPNPAARRRYTQTGLTTLICEGPDIHVFARNLQGFVAGDGTQGRHQGHVAAVRLVQQLDGRDAVRVDLRQRLVIRLNGDVQP
jgi:hypothetical protein